MKNNQKPNDLFTPEHVDERIEQLLQAQNEQKQQQHVETQLVQQLQSIYQEDADILKHARERLFQRVPGTTETKTSPVSQPHNRYKGSYTMYSQADILSVSKHKKHPVIQHMSLLVAGLVAALLVGSLVAVLALVHHTQTSTAGTPHPVSQQPTSKPKSAHEVSTRSAGPWGIALDEKRGYVYVAAPGCNPMPPCSTTFPTIIGQHSLADGHIIRQFAQPKGYSNPFFVAVNPVDGHVWFTEPNSDAIGELNPNKGTWAQYKTKSGSVPWDLIFDNNGHIWFTSFNSSSIGFLDINTHKIIETPTPTAQSSPYGLTKDRKGNIWFTENGPGISQIGLFTPSTSGKINIKEFSIDSTHRSQPHLITAAPNGHIWFSEGFQGTIGEFDPATGKAAHYQVATTPEFATSVACRRPPVNCTHISGIAADRQGNIWFSDSLNATVGYYNPAKRVEKVKELHDPNAHPHDGLAVQSDGTIWFTEEFGSEIKGDPVQGPVLVMWPDGIPGDNGKDMTVVNNSVQEIKSFPTPTVVTPTPTPVAPLPTVAPSN